MHFTIKEKICNVALALSSVANVVTTKGVLKAVYQAGSRRSNGGSGLRSSNRWCSSRRDTERTPREISGTDLTGTDTRKKTTQRA